MSAANIHDEGLPLKFDRVAFANALMGGEQGKDVSLGAGEPSNIARSR